MEKLKAVAYCRVSTIMQEEGRSLEFQIKKCQDYCEFQNYELIEIIQDVESGGNDDREGFLELREKVRAKAFDVLVVFESSRISRVTLTMLNFVLELQKSNIHFVSISQPELNTTTPTGMLFFTIQATLSEYERKQISVRVKSNKWARAKAGIWQGGKLPLGYKKDPENNNVILIDEDNALFVQNIFSYYLKTQSLAKTAKEFGKHMESLKWILTNTFYTGIFRYGKKENNINTGIVKINEDYQYFEGFHPPIIDNETFNKVQDLIVKNKKNRPVSYRLLFAGLVYCSCGGKYHSSFGGGGYNYRCEKCKKNISAKKLEQAILDKIFLMTELEELNNNDLQNEKYQEEIKLLKKIIVKDKKEKEKNLLLFKNEIINIEELKKEMDKISSSIISKEKEIKELEKLISNNELNSEKSNNFNLLKEVVKNMENEDREELNKLFKLLIDKILILNKNEINVYNKEIKMSINIK